VNTYERLKQQWDRLLAVVGTGVGVAALVLGWLGVSSKSLITEQVPYLASGAVGGLFALGAAATLWLSADLRDEFAKLDDIYSWLRGGEGESQEPAVDAGAAVCASGDRQPEAGYTAPAARHQRRER
jgi:hypothetical protein